MLRNGAQPPPPPRGRPPAQALTLSVGMRAAHLGLAGMPIATYCKGIRPHLFLSKTTKESKSHSIHRDSAIFNEQKSTRQRD